MFTNLSRTLSTIWYWEGSVQWAFRAIPMRAVRVNQSGKELAVKPKELDEKHHKGLESGDNYLWLLKSDPFHMQVVT